MQRRSLSNRGKRQRQLYVRRRRVYRIKQKRRLERGTLRKTIQESWRKKATCSLTITKTIRANLLVYSTNLKSGLAL